jgi:hypothetical protein
MLETNIKNRQKTRSPNKFLQFQIFFWTSSILNMNFQKERQ